MPATNGAKSNYSAVVGAEMEKRPGLDALVARAICFFVLYLFMVGYSPVAVPSLLGRVFVFATEVGFGLISAWNALRWLTLRRLTYGLEATAVAICLGLRTLRFSYQKIVQVEPQDTPWPIKKATLFTYAKEIPQLIEYVAQIGAFVVEGRGKIYLYSTLSSYHDPKGLILITTTDGKIYGISPAEPERFLEELEKRRRQASPQ